MRVLVTGGAGFIGSHIVDQLVSQGAEVVVLDSLSPHEGVPDYLPSSVDLRVGDLSDEKTVRSAVDGVDAVCHQAARVGLGVDFNDVSDYVRDNDGGTANLLRALWQRSFQGRLVVASSMVVYGEGRYLCDSHGETRALPRQTEDLRQGRFDPRCEHCDRPLRWASVEETTALDPRNVYAATKVHTEHLSFAFARESGCSVGALRYHNVYGPRMPRDTPYAGVASIFRSALENQKAPQVFEDGQQMRDFVHVSDVARSNVLALDSEWNGACNIASGQPHNILDMARALANGYPDTGLVPEVTGEFRLGDVRHIVAAPDLAQDVLGFQAEVDFATGMAEFAHDPLR